MNTSPAHANLSDDAQAPSPAPASLPLTLTDNFCSTIFNECASSSHSARRHKIRKARARQVFANPPVVERIVEEQDGVLVMIRAMDLRPKFRALYDERKRS